MDSKGSPRRSPPPLVSLADNTRRDSLVGLQRLVYNAQVLSQDKEDVKTALDDESAVKDQGMCQQ